MAERKDEDGLNILIGLILIVFVALALIWAFSGTSSCPENTFSCDNSPCGCCVADANNNSIASCDFGVCPEGTYFFEGMGCCPSTDPVSCLKPYSSCKTIIPCGDSFCCGSDKCELQDDGSSKCIPCSAGSVCNPEDVNSCCEGYACGSDGTCKNVNSCIGMTCSNYNQPCQVCGSDSSNCISCEDNSLCLLNPITNQGTCTEMCAPGFPACPHCPSGCCNGDGTCTSCLNNNCNNPGSYCALNSLISCSEICANVDGKLSCQSTGNCPSGYYTCNNPDCPTGCCSAIDGSCASCLGNSCSIEEEGQACSFCSGDSCVACSNTICESRTCVSSNSVLSCPTGYILSGNKCVKSTEPIIEDNEENPDNPIYTCPEGFILQNNVCINPNDNTDPIQNEDYEDSNTDGIPDWLLNLQTSCFEECEDCKDHVCSENPYDYDLNGDTYLNALDLNIFIDYYKTITPPVNVENSQFDFTKDGIIDQNDYNCILNFCSDGTCRIIGFNETGLCVTSEYFNNSFTQEQRASFPDYDLLFNNIAEQSYLFSCSWTNSRNRPFCNEMSKELGEIFLVRNLSYVKLDRDINTYYYSSCNYYKNNVFGMYIESPSCSNEINIYHSNEFLYKAMAYGMAIFNNCVKSTSQSINVLGTVYEGDCYSFKDNVVDECIDLYASKEDCEKCDECDYYTSSYCPDTAGCQAYFGTGDEGLENVLKCIPCAFNPSACDSNFVKMCNLCVDYNSCVNCQNHYKGSPTCTKCEKCEKVGNKVSSTCTSRNTLASIDFLLEEYRKAMAECNKYSGITSSNCIVYSECMKEVNSHNVCYNLAINSYWIKDGDKFSKQIYCYYNTAEYESEMAKKYIELSENVVYSSGDYSEMVKGTFKGFVEKCPYDTPVECVENCVNNAQSCITNCLIENIGQAQYCTNLCTTNCIKNC